MINVIGICPTYNRPYLVPNDLAMWELQDFPTERRHLIVYDDANQFRDQNGPNWSIVSRPDRCPTLGEKFDTLVRMAAFCAETRGWLPEETAIALFEDDDVYFPHYLSAHVKTLETGVDWSAPSKILANDSVGRGKWHVSSACGRHHGAWAYRLSAYLKSGGYPHVNADMKAGIAGLGFDLLFSTRMRAMGLEPKDTLESGCGPIYLYRWFSVPGVFNGSADLVNIDKTQGKPSKTVYGRVVPRLDDETRGYYEEFYPYYVENSRLDV